MSEQSRTAMGLTNGLPAGTQGRPDSLIPDARSVECWTDFDSDVSHDERLVELRE